MKALFNQGGGGGLWGADLHRLALRFHFKTFMTFVIFAHANDSIAGNETPKTRNHFGVFLLG